MTQVPADPIPSTAAIADACVRLGIRASSVPSLRPVSSGLRMFGRARLATHKGSVADLFAALDEVWAGDVLVIDNEWREEEACIGDLFALEARMAGVAGLLVLGRHRDTQALIEIALPVFSLGAVSNGPLARLEPLSKVRAVPVETGDLAVADDDGVLFVATGDIDSLVAVAGDIERTEAAQAAAIRSGQPLRDQLRFAEYQARHATDPAYTFRDHLVTLRGAIE